MNEQSTLQEAVAPTGPTAALSVEGLEVVYTVRGIDRAVLRGVTFEVAPGEAYGLVGESGCGKSTTAYASMRYLPRNGKIAGGTVHVAGRDVTAMSEAELRQFRSSEASMVYQDPAQAMNPTLRIGRQVIEAFTLLGHSKADAEKLALDSLRRVRIADPTRVPAVGRHAAACCHRDGVGVQSQAARARRAHHRPRRDR
jgi:peptide/nickel transport system ATP-binding protein